tara:strand:- start:774 stop:995 length:222 start_codon:yes stop_codon:yes gene_type:complete
MALEFDGSTGGGMNDSQEPGNITEPGMGAVGGDGEGYTEVGGVGGVSNYVPKKENRFIPILVLGGLMYYLGVF